MGSQHLLPRPVLLLQAVHNKDTEIIPQAENKGGKDNIHDIELRSGSRHHPRIITQLTAIGVKVIKVSSIRP